MLQENEIYTLPVMYRLLEAEKIITVAGKKNGSLIILEK